MVGGQLRELVPAEDREKAFRVLPFPYDGGLRQLRGRYVLEPDLGVLGQCGIWISFRRDVLTGHLKQRRLFL